MGAVTLAAIALAVVLMLVVAAAANVIGRALKAADRRERRLELLLEQQDARHLEVLDRVMYASGKPWKETADRAPTEAPRPPDPWKMIVEDPVAGADYSGGMDDLEDELFPGNPLFPPQTFDTTTLEAGI